MKYGAPDARTDVFALGAVLCEMATGKRAFEGRSKTSLVAAILSAPPQPISAVGVVVPPGLERVGLFLPLGHRPLARLTERGYAPLVRATSLTDALEAMASMEKGRPYALRLEDGKRRLADDLARLCERAEIRPVVIGGLAVNHHGYMRVTADVDILVARRDAVALYRRLRSEPGWKRYAEGFKNTQLGVGLDICVEGERTAPRSEEEFPDPGQIDTIDLDPLPVPTLPELVALKVMSGRARDDADVVELLKRHRSRMTSLKAAAARRLRTAEARARLGVLVARARAEATRRR